MNNKQAAQGAGVSKQVDELATISVEELFRRLGTSEAGLSEEEAERRLDQYGPNEIAEEKARTWVHRLFTASRNPLVILLTVLATISYATGDFRAGTVMLLMVILGLSLRFVQESRADAAAAKLKAMISVTATVVRNGEAREIPLQRLVRTIAKLDELLELLRDTKRELSPTESKQLQQELAQIRMRLLQEKSLKGPDY